MLFYSYRLSAGYLKVLKSEDKEGKMPYCGKGPRSGPQKKRRQRPQKRKAKKNKCGNSRNTQEIARALGWKEAGGYLYPPHRLPDREVLAKLLAILPE